MLKKKHCSQTYTQSYYNSIMIIWLGDVDPDITIEETFCLFLSVKFRFQLSSVKITGT